jgi:NAD(P)-dependent dehydrogenase (short-subunit alcohol dehydrogenase family)
VQAGGAAVAIRADVSSEAAVVALFEKIDEEAGLPPLTSLVNNAGVIGAGGRHVDATDQLETASTKDFDAVMSTNVLGPLICCREAAKRMPRGSTIVNLGSISTKAGSPLIYAMTKGALMSMQRGLVPTLGAKGIRINTVSPGLVVTDMTTELFQDPAIRAAVKTQYPLGRFGAPEDIAGAVSYLCSDDAAWTSGTDLLASRAASFRSECKWWPVYCMGYEAHGTHTQL